MQIIRHGDPRWTDRLHRFRCVFCGCEWIAGPHEVYRNINGLDNACYCPDCHELTRAKDDANELSTRWTN